MAVLDLKIQGEIDKLRDLAFERQKENKIDEMNQLFDQSWALYPEPKVNWNEAYNSAKYAFCSYIQLKDFEKAKLWINRMKDVNNNLHLNEPEVLFYRGVYLFEAGQLEVAYEEFKELVDNFGYRSFQGEDPKYKKFVKDPAGYLSATPDNTAQEESIPTELSDELYEEIEALLESGDEAAEEEEFEKAIELYDAALNKLPGDPTDWEPALHIYTALGDAYYNLDDLENAHLSYSRALMCPGGVEAGYVWFRYGQVLYEQDEVEKAEDAFMRAYMLEGEEIFEHIDPSYLELIEKHIRK